MWPRRLISALAGVAGALGVLLLVVAMNGGSPRAADDDRVAATAFDVAPPPPPPPKPEPPPPREKPKPRERPPPAPIVGASLGGLAFGLAGLGDAALAAGADDLLGDTDDVVMTEASVDVPPRPLHRAAPVYPERARKKGVTGRVVLSLLIDATGAVQDVRVTESAPQGVFDEAAADAVRAWRFQPAQYEGRAVAIRVTLPLSFGFDP